MTDLDRITPKHPWHVRAWLSVTKPYRDWKTDRDAKRKLRAMKRVGYFVLQHSWWNAAKPTYTVWEARENGLGRRELIKLSGPRNQPPAAIAVWARGDDSARVFLHPEPYWTGKGETVSV